MAETNSSGNYLNAWRVPLVTYGKNTNQAEALIGDAVASVVEYAREVGKPIVIEGAVQLGWINPLRPEQNPARRKPKPLNA